MDQPASRFRVLMKIRWTRFFRPMAGGSHTSCPQLRVPTAAGWYWCCWWLAGLPVTLGQLAGPTIGLAWKQWLDCLRHGRGGAASIRRCRNRAGRFRRLSAGTRERTIGTAATSRGRQTRTVCFGTFDWRTKRRSGRCPDAGRKADRRILVVGTDSARASRRSAFVHSRGNALAVPSDINRTAVTGGQVWIIEGVTENRKHVCRPICGFVGWHAGLRAWTNPRCTCSHALWMNRQGHVEPIPAKPRAYENARLSPDGTKIAVASEDEEHDIWVFDLAKETLTRLTFGAAIEFYAAWAPDGKYLYYSSGQITAGITPPADIFRKAADGTGRVESLTLRMEVRVSGCPRAPDGVARVCERLFQVRLVRLGCSIRRSRFAR